VRAAHGELVLHLSIRRSVALRLTAAIVLRSFPRLRNLRPCAHGMLPFLALLPPLLTLVIANVLCCLAGPRKRNCGFNTCGKCTEHARAISRLEAGYAARRA
jgi:hypothetical protein